MESINEKKCPLSMSDPENVPLISCRQAECAWWDEDAQAGALLVMAKVLKKRK